MTIVSINKYSLWFITEEIVQYIKLSSRKLNRNMNNLKYGLHYFRKHLRILRSPVLLHLDSMEDYFSKHIAPRNKKKRLLHNVIITMDLIMSRA